jgi:hypothetical protein
MSRASESPSDRSRGSQARKIRQFCGDPERTVERATAEFVVRQILTELVGARRADDVRFRTEVVTISDILAVLERRTSGGGWRLLQRKAEIRADPGA